MILHWLAGYSLWRLMIVVGGGIICIGSVINLLYGQEDKNRVPMPVSLVGLLIGSSLAVSALLRGRPPWDGLGDALSAVGAVSGIVYLLLLNRHRRRKRVTVPPPQSAVPSDEIWPPPPTSRGGD